MCKMQLSLFFVFLLLLEVRRSHQQVVTISQGDSVYLDCTEPGEPNEFFRYAYAKDIGAIASLELEKVAAMEPHLQDTIVSCMGTSMKPTFQYLLDLCTDRWNVRRLDREASNVFQFVYDLGVTNGRRNTGSTTDRPFFATKIRLGQKEAKKYFAEIEERERQGGQDMAEPAQENAVAARKKVKENPATSEPATDAAQSSAPKKISSAPTRTQKTADPGTVQKAVQATSGVGKKAVEPARQKSRAAPASAKVPSGRSRGN